MSYFNGILYPVLSVVVKCLREQFVTTTLQSSLMYHQDAEHMQSGHKTNWYGTWLSQGAPREKFY